MAQARVYGLRGRLDPIKAALSDVIHPCVVDAPFFPPGKRAHRLSPLEAEDLYYPDGRCAIIEASMFEGRSANREATIGETLKHNRSFRGQLGDEIGLGYKTEAQDGRQG